jgi:hypothetical protein
MRGRYTTKEERESIRREYQNGAKIGNLVYRYKVSDKTIKRIVGLYEYPYAENKKDVKQITDITDTNANSDATAEKVITEYINNRINYLNEQIIKLSNEKRKLQDFYDYLNKKGE